MLRDLERLGAETAYAPGHWASYLDTAGDVAGQLAIDNPAGVLLIGLGLWLAMGVMTRRRGSR